MCVITVILCKVTLVSGLVCSLYNINNISPDVYFLILHMEFLIQGIHGLGGRMGTRAIDPQPLIFDHAAQFFTVTDPEFAKMVDLWSKKGLVRQWHGVVGDLDGGCFNALPSSPPRYIGVNGMRPLADLILSEVVWSIFLLVTLSFCKACLFVSSLCS